MIKNFKTGLRLCKHRADELRSRVGVHGVAAGGRERWIQDGRDANHDHVARGVDRLAPVRHDGVVTAGIEPAVPAFLPPGGLSTRLDQVVAAHPQMHLRGVGDEGIARNRKVGHAQVRYFDHLVQLPEDNTNCTKYINAVYSLFLGLGEDISLVSAASFEERNTHALRHGLWKELSQTIRIGLLDAADTFERPFHKTTRAKQAWD